MRNRLPLLLCVAALLVLALIAARGRSAVPETGGLVIAPQATTTTTSAPATASGQLNPVLGAVAGVAITVWILLVLVLALFGLAMVVIALGSMRRRKIGTSAPHGETPEADSDVDARVGAALLRGVRSGIELLDRREGGPPTEAVQAAWLAMETAAAGTGTPREPHQTPTEFTASLLAAHTVSATAVDELRGLYHRARFGDTDGLTAQDADAAIAALRRIEADLGASMPGTVPGNMP